MGQELLYGGVEHRKLRATWHHFAWMTRLEASRKPILHGSMPLALVTWLPSGFVHFGPIGVASKAYHNYRFPRLRAEDRTNQT